MQKINTIKAHSWRSGNYTDDFEPMDYDMGMRVDDSADGKPKIQLFSISHPMDVASFEDSFYAVCEGVINDHFPDQDITDFDWEFNASAARTDIHFDTQHGVITNAHFTNGFALRNSFFQTRIESYENALSDPENYTNILSDGHPERYEGAPITRVIVPLPEHPAGHIAMEPTHMSGLESDDHKLVLVDTNKLWDQLIAQTMHNHGLKSMDDVRQRYDAEPSKGDDVAFPPFHCTTEESIAHISPHKGYPGETPYASLHITPPETMQDKPNGWIEKLESLINRWTDNANPQPLAENIEFTNGRHRTLNMMKLGAPYVPMTVHKGDNADILEEKFGWKGNQKVSPEITNTHDLSV